MREEGGRKKGRVGPESAGSGAASPTICSLTVRCQHKTPGGTSPTDAIHAMARDCHFTAYTVADDAIEHHEMPLTYQAASGGAGGPVCTSSASNVSQTRAVVHQCKVYLSPAALIRHFRRPLLVGHVRHHVRFMWSQK